MLELLRIRNLALIEDMEIEFSSGMNVLTGETGAGKSFVLKALEFVVGEKLAIENVRPGKDKAIVEALFAIQNEPYILRRELFAESGRSRFYINDRLASQESVRALRSSLLLHTSQHEQQKLLQAAFQMKLLDDFIATPELIAQKNTLLGKLNACRTKCMQLEEKAQQLAEKRDMLEYQQSEINKVTPKLNEEEELEALRSSMGAQSNAAEQAAHALDILHGVNDDHGLLQQTAVLERTCTQLAKFEADFSPTLTELAHVQDILHDLVKRLEKMSRRTFAIDSEEIEARLYALAQLKRKLKRTLPEIIAMQDEINDNLSFLDACELDQKLLHKEEEILGDRLAAIVQSLNAERKTAAALLAAKLQSELVKLGFSEHVRVLFRFDPYPLHPHREDCFELRPKLFWQPNPGQQEQPLEHIASGGELSRFLLALTSLLSKSIQGNPTLIFDEVDAGVGGVTLNRVGDSLAELAGKQQLLLVTHWPHLAKRAQRHFLIKKTISSNETFTNCQQLSSDEEIQNELARMAGEEIMPAE